VLAFGRTLSPMCTDSVRIQTPFTAAARSGRKVESGIRFAPNGACCQTSSVDTLRWRRC
jgi:hypothetical protein